GRVLTRADLAAHVLLTVRGPDPRLNLPTQDLEQQSTVVLPDFHSKKAAILQQLGFGWLPDWLTETELEAGLLVPLRVDGAASHTFEPRAAYRGGRLGPAARAVLDTLKRA
ncbi:MAG: LysR family transcriptional regulator, partial [Archangium sp.]|nr:LysR family transcriptional regulator [Archangium sp.]